MNPPLVEILLLINKNITNQTKRVKDERFKPHLHRNHDDNLVQMEERILEYSQERRAIRDTAAKLCVFLKNNSLAPYHDNMIRCLDSLIEEERAKLHADGKGHSSRLLDMRLPLLEAERNLHNDAVSAIMRNINSNSCANDLSEGGIDRMVQSLYNLKHFGHHLPKMKENIATAHRATYFEGPYTTDRRNQPMGP